MVDIQEIANETEKVIEAVMKVEPIIMTMSSFVPGAKPVMAIVHPAVVAMAPFIEKALTDIASGNNGDAFAAFITMLQHISKGQPNTTLLAEPQPVTNG